MNIIIAGGRDFKDNDLLVSTLDNFIFSNNVDLEKLKIIAGEATGADELGRKYAKDHNIDLKEFNAPWATMGNKAGPFRNKLMADYAIKYKDKDDEAILFAFWNGTSAGTKNMIYQAEKHGMKVIIVNANY